VILAEDGEGSQLNKSFRLSPSQRRNPRPPPRMIRLPSSSLPVARRIRMGGVPVPENAPGLRVSCTLQPFAWVDDVK
jgi:hypothetical protein